MLHFDRIKLSACTTHALYIQRARPASFSKTVYSLNRSQQCCSHFFGLESRAIADHATCMCSRVFGLECTRCRSPYHVHVRQYCSTPHVLKPVGTLFVHSELFTNSQASYFRQGPGCRALHMRSLKPGNASGANVWQCSSQRKIAIMEYGKVTDNLPFHMLSTNNINQEVLKPLPHLPMVAPLDLEHPRWSYRYSFTETASRDKRRREPKEFCNDASCRKVHRKF